jgi:hypothetical protein
MCFRYKGLTHALDPAKAGTLTVAADGVKGRQCLVCGAGLHVGCRFRPGSLVLLCAPTANHHPVLNLQIFSGGVRRFAGLGGGSVLGAF